MKTRNGFVSNSSSSSFVVHLSKISALERGILLQYETSDENEDGWSIREEDDYLKGFTVMDNGALRKFLQEKNICYCRWDWECD